MTEEFAEVSRPERPRDHRGQFIPAGKPEPFLATRDLEGDPITGDTSDGGPDPRFQEQERRIADGWIEEGDGDGQGRQAGRVQQRRSASNNAARVQHAAGDDGHALYEESGGRIFDSGESEQSDSDVEGTDDVDAGEAAEGDSRRVSERDAEGEADAGAGEGERYEVSVDGETRHVTLEEALRGYVREATFHVRMQNLANVQHELENQNANLRQSWALWHKARQDYEEDLTNLVPKEPDWEQEFQRNPAAAYQTQKIYQILYGKLAQSRQARAEREAYEAQEADRKLAVYATNGFAKFLFDNKIDQRDKDKILRWMRQTAVNAGFNEYEISTVYDPRMLTILFKAGKYDRIQASRPRAIVPGKGRTLPPGAATPIGNAHRKGIDEAQRRLANSGSLEDAADVFRRMF